MTAPTPTPAARYRKRPVTIEAVQLAQRFPWPDWFHDAVTANKIITHGLGKFADGPVWCEIETLEGVMRASEGDWIIRGVAGEIYPCKPEIFSATYEPAGTPTPDAETREAMIERAMETVKREYARFLFGNDDRTFENSFTADFQEQFAEDQGRLFAAGLDAILSSGLVVPAAEVEETKRLLSDPNAVHINMLAGKIAKPSVEQIVHVYAGRIVPAHTVSDLAVMHMERYQAIADLAERDAQIARLREALVDAEEVLALVERPAFPDPRHHEEVKALGRRIGFGALMSTASAGWAEANRAEGYPDSGVFVAGPCIGTVHGTLRRIRAALGETKP